MSSSMKKTDAYVGSTDLFKVDPRKILIREGWNPRIHFEIDELKESIRDNGFYLEKAVLLNRKDNELYLVDGERRLRAVLALIDEGVDIKAIPAVLETSRDEGELLARALASNSNAAALQPLEEAQAFRRLMHYGWTQQQIAAKVGRSVGHIYGRLSLLEAEPEVHRAMEEKKITTSDAVRVVQESSRTGATQATVLEKKVAARIERKIAPKVVEAPVVQGGADNDEAHLVKAVKTYGPVWVIEVLKAMDFTAEQLHDAITEVYKE